MAPNLPLDVNRYYLPPEQWSENTLTITGEEAHHALRVMRQKESDKIEIFDGRGNKSTCTIVSTSRSEVRAEISDLSKQDQPSHPITLCQAIPKSGNMELIVQKSVELGVHAIQPLITAHTVARPDSIAKKTSKWQRIALEACKQCGQNYLPSIYEPLNFSEWIKKPNQSSLRIVAAIDPCAKHLKDVLAQTPELSDIELLIGPEGDFSPEEYADSYAAEFLPITLGDIILRVETASIYCLSALKHELSA